MRSMYNISIFILDRTLINSATSIVYPLFLSVRIRFVIFGYSVDIFAPIGRKDSAAVPHISNIAHLVND